MTQTPKFGGSELGYNTQKKKKEEEEEEEEREREREGKEKRKKKKNPVSKTPDQGRNLYKVKKITKK